MKNYMYAEIFKQELEKLNIKVVVDEKKLLFYVREESLEEFKRNSFLIDEEVKLYGIKGYQYFKQPDVPKNMYKLIKPLILLEDDEIFNNDYI